MLTIDEIRSRVQAPRKAIDAWYGRHVARFFSAYVTWAAFRMKLTPNFVTLLSLAAGIAGFCAAVKGSFWGWILGMNAWYILDHSDGELARLQERSSNTGYFFDTVLNFIVQPLFYVGLGVVLSSDFENFHVWGWVAAFSTNMLAIIPMTEEVILYHALRKQPAPEPKLNENSMDDSGSSFPKKLFSFMHACVLLPNVLAAVTAVMLAGLIMPSIFELLPVVLTACACVSTLVWIMVLAQRVLTRKLD